MPGCLIDRLADGWTEGLTDWLTDRFDSHAHLLAISPDNDWSWLQISWRWLWVRVWLVWPIHVLKACPHKGHMWAIASAAVQLTDTILSASMTLLIMCTDTSHSAPLSLSAPNDWLVYWIIDSLIHWLTRAKKTDWFTEWHTNWMAEWLTKCLINRLTGLMTNCLLFLSRLFAFHGLIDWLSDRWSLADTCLLNRRTNRSTGWLRKRKRAKRSGSQQAKSANYLRQWSYCKYATLPFLNGVKYCNYSWCYQCCFFHVS